MNILTLFLDVSQSFGIFFVVALGFIALAAAFFAFTLLRKTVKMAIRMVIVGVILLIAVVGSVSFWWFSSGSTSKPRPSPTRPR